MFILFADQGIYKLYSRYLHPNNESVPAETPKQCLGNENGY